MGEKFWKVNVNASLIVREWPADDTQILASYSRTIGAYNQLLSIYHLTNL